MFPPGSWRPPALAPVFRRGVATACTRRLPFPGRVACGRPIAAVAGGDDLAVPDHLLGGRGGEHYVLEVVGESMAGEGIFGGDLVVVRRRSEARPGEMVVALIGGEVTLKRYYPEGETVRLEPSNPAMETLRVPAAELVVQGVVVGLMRKY